MLSIPGRFNRLAQKFLSLKGPALITDASSELFWTIALRSGPELAYLEGWDRFSNFSRVTATALNGSAWQIRNPTGSGVLVLVEKLQLGVGGTADTPNLSIGAAAADLATVNASAANIPLDSRGRSAPTAVTSSQNTVAGVVAVLGPGGQLGRPSILANTVLDMLLHPGWGVTVLPGQGLRVASSVVNQETDVACWWWERLLEESERT